MRRLLLVVLFVAGLVLASSSAFAGRNDSPYPVYGDAKTAADAAGQADVAARTAARAQCLSTATNPNTQCGAVNPRYYLIDQDANKRIWYHYCESGTPASGSIEDCSYNEYFTYTAVRVPDSCGPAGTVVTKNVTMGYSGTPTPDGAYGRADFKPDGTPNPTGAAPVMPSAMCINGCMHTVGAGGDFFESLQPTSGGMYRISRDYSFTTTSVTCTAQANDGPMVDGTIPAPTGCQGSQGYVQGRPACLPKSSTPADPKLSDANKKTGNPKAGSPPTDPNRIPAENGDGGNKGGPPHPKDGTTTTPGGTTMTPTPTTDSGKQTATSGQEQLNCGAPGQPKCRIDETGTPGTVTMALDEKTVKDAADAARGEIGGSGDKTMFSSWGSVFVTPPVVACEPISFTVPGGATYASDPCPVVNDMRTLMGYLWALGGFWVCLGWIREAV